MTIEERNRKEAAKIVRELQELGIQDFDSEEEEAPEEDCLNEKTFNGHLDTIRGLPIYDREWSALNLLGEYKLSSVQIKKASKLILDYDRAGFVSKLTKAQKKQTTQITNQKYNFFLLRAIESVVDYIHMFFSDIREFMGSHPFFTKFVFSCIVSFIGYFIFGNPVPGAIAVSMIWLLS